MISFRPLATKLW